MEIKVSGNPLVKALKYSVFFGLFFMCVSVVLVWSIVYEGKTEADSRAQVSVAAVVQKAIPTAIPKSDPDVCGEGEARLQTGNHLLPQGNDCGWKEVSKVVYLTSRCCRQIWGPGTTIYECPSGPFGLWTIRVCY